MWIARDKDDKNLRLFPVKPYRNGDKWDSGNYNFLWIQALARDHEDSDNFSYIKWEDEPVEVILAKRK